MQIRPGSLLIAHPVHSNTEHRKHLVYITESNSINTVGVILNKLSNYDMCEFMQQKGRSWYGDRAIHVGGIYNPHSLIMLHDNNWYSSHTMQVNSRYNVSSDVIMLEKMEMGNTPDWYKLFIGCTAWSASELEQELKSKKPEWLLIPNPTDELVQSDISYQWDHAVAEYSQDVFDAYF